MIGITYLTLTLNIYNTVQLKYAHTQAGVLDANSMSLKYLLFLWFLFYTIRHIVWDQKYVQCSTLCLYSIEPQEN